MFEACGHALGSKKIGVVIPSTNTVVEPDFYRHAPEEVTVHAARFVVRDATVPSDPGELERRLLGYLDGIGEAIRAVATCRCHAVGIGFFIETSFWGYERDLEIANEWSADAGTPVVTATSALKASLEAVNARRIGVITPYFDGANQRLATYLQEAGFEVVQMGGAASETPWACAGYDMPRVVEMFRAIDSERIDTLCAAGSNLPAVKAAAAYQRESGKPVISGNLALLEQLLRRAGVRSTVAPRDPENG